MTQILKRALPFLLTFAIGIACASIAERLFWYRSHCPPRSAPTDVSRITIESVPNADFPQALKKRGPGGGIVRLIAVFDADGSIKSIRPYPMVPFGVDESTAGSGKFADVTPFMSGGRFVSSLPYGLTELAIEQVSKIKYKPRTANRKPASQTVFVLTDFSYTDSEYSVGCSSVDLTIMDDSGVLWLGNTWIGRDRGCLMI